MSKQLYKKIYGSKIVKRLREEGRKKSAGYYQSLFLKYKIQKILDLGCGTGSFWRWIDNGNLKVVGLDLNFDSRIYPFKGIYGNACQLPFKDNSFDCVFSNSVIEHIPSTEQGRMVEEMLRVAKIVILQSPNRHFPIELHTCLPLLGFFPTVFINWYLKRNKWSSLWLFSKHVLLSLIHKHGEIMEVKEEKKWGFTKGYIVVFAPYYQRPNIC